MNSDKQAEMDVKALEKPARRGWSKRRKLIIGGIVALVIIIGLAVGLGVGLTRSNDNNDNSDGSSSTDPNNTQVNGTVPDNIWKPAVGLTWDLKLSTPLNSTTDLNPHNVQVIDIDLFDNNASMIAAAQATGAKVICYFSAGSYEDWRADKNDFLPSDLGKDMDGWPGEKWINISSPNVHKIMAARLDIAAQKKCDGVDPDNINVYANDNGLGLTQQDSINFMGFLADESHKRGLAIGLKNSAEIIPDVISVMEWCINESCAAYDECAPYQAFTEQGKPVFHVEYPKGTETNNDLAVTETQLTDACDAPNTKGFSTIIKNINLNTWIEFCPSNTTSST